MAAIDQVEGIGPAYAGKLRTAGIRSTNALLESGGTPRGREAIADKTGIGAHLILEWVNRADLFRIKGVGSEYSDLLEAAGVDSVPELARRNAANLAAAIVKLNEQRKLVRSVPSESQIAHWIAQANRLDRVVQY